jgi:hypothetical protein
MAAGRFRPSVEKDSFRSARGVTSPATSGFILIQFGISCVVALLKAGSDFATISQWLGHESPNTTVVYTAGQKLRSANWRSNARAKVGTGVRGS